MIRNGAERQNGTANGRQLPHRARLARLDLVPRRQGAHRGPRAADQAAAVGEGGVHPELYGDAGRLQDVQHVSFPSFLFGCLEMAVLDGANGSRTAPKYKTWEPVVAERR